MAQFRALPMFGEHILDLFSAQPKFRPQLCKSPLVRVTLGSFRTLGRSTADSRSIERRGQIQLGDATPAGYVASDYHQRTPP